MQEHEDFLAVQETMPSVSFDKERLFAWVHQIVAQYENLAVTESDIRSAKEVMATLNKQAKALDDARRETVKRVSAPIKSFEADIKEAHQRIINARSLIAQQVKIFEEKQRNEKRIVVQSLIDELCAKYEELEIEIEGKWLNKSTSLSIIKDELLYKIKEHEEVLRQRSMLEQAKKERIAFIEQFVLRLNREFGFNYSISTFLHAHYIDPVKTSVEQIKQEIEDSFKAEARKMHENQGQSTSAHNVMTQNALDTPDPSVTTLQITFTAREETIEKIRVFFREIRPELMLLEARKLN